MARILKGLTIAFLVLFILFLVTYFNLNIGQDPQHSDVIIVPEGFSERSRVAVDLLKQGYAESDKIIVTPIYDGPVNLLSTYQRHGATDDNIIAETSATSTWTNATNTIKIMEDQGWKSALVVTSDFHTRRTKMSFDRASKGKDLTFTYVASYPLQGDKEQTYFDSNYNRTRAAIEVFKYWGYLLGLYSMIDL